MDESEQKASEDTPASDSTVDSKRVTESSSESEMGNRTSASADSSKTTPTDPSGASEKVSSEAVETSSQESVKKSGEEDGKEAEGEKGGGSRETPEVQPPGSTQGRKKPTSTAISTEHDSPDDKTLKGANSEPTEPPAGNDIMARMMEIMVKGSASATPKAPEVAKGSASDRMSKGGGMPDMMAMMSGGGSMAGMKAMMAKGGMPDMMTMMSGGGSMSDMKAMMSKMEGNPMGMAKLFDCIIDVSLAKPDSDSSDDDADSITIEIPCQYCSRFFTSQMSLKTHILVAHEHEDTSVLNIKKLVIDKGKRSVKDHHGSRRKQSKDYESSIAVETASMDSHQRVTDSINTVTSSQKDLLAAESSRGVKRGRSERRGSGAAAEISGSSGVEEAVLPGDPELFRLGSGILPSGGVPGSSPESRKRSARLRSLGSSSSGEASSQVTTKKSKSGDNKRSGDSNSDTQEIAPSGDPPSQPSSATTKPGSQQPSTGDPKSQGSAKETSKHKQIKTDTAKHPPLPARPTRSTRLSRKDKDAAASDSEVSVEAAQSHQGDKGSSGGRDGSSRSRGRQSRSVPTSSMPADSSSAQGREGAAASRRSLRSGKSH